MTGLWLEMFRFRSLCCVLLPNTLLVGGGGGVTFIQSNTLILIQLLHVMETGLSNGLIGLFAGILLSTKLRGTVNNITNFPTP